MKALQITPAMQERINAAAGTEVEPSSISAFECLALSRLPINKPGSIFDGAVNDPSMYADLARMGAAKGGIPLQSMHETDLLPLGRVFYSQETTDGLRAQFYVPNAKPEVADINNGVIGSVSMGMLAKHLLCSECQWDYRGDAATMMNIFDQTCGNGHVIGQNGVHLILKGVDNWLELSLCGTGASPGSKIMSRLKTQLKNSGTDLAILAASGMTPEAILTITPATSDEEDMNVAEFTTQLTEKVTQIGNLTTELAAANTAKADLTTQLSASQVEVGRLTTELTAANTAKDTATAQVTELTAEKTTLETSNTELMTYLTDQGKKAMVILGLKADDLPKDFAGITAKLTEAGTTLAAVIANGNKSQTTTQLTDKGKSAIPPSAFSTRKLTQS